MGDLTTYTYARDIALNELTGNDLNDNLVFFLHLKNNYYNTIKGKEGLYKPYYDSYYPSLNQYQTRLNSMFLQNKEKGSLSALQDKLDKFLSEKQDEISLNFSPTNISNFKIKLNTALKEGLSLGSIIKETGTSVYSDILSKLLGNGEQLNTALSQLQKLKSTFNKINKIASNDLITFLDNINDNINTEQDIEKGTTKDETIKELKNAKDCIQKLNEIFKNINDNEKDKEINNIIALLNTLNISFSSKGKKEKAENIQNNIEELLKNIDIIFKHFTNQQVSFLGEEVYGAFIRQLYIDVINKAIKNRKNNPNISNETEIIKETEEEAIREVLEDINIFLTGTDKYAQHYLSNGNDNKKIIKKKKTESSFIKVDINPQLQKKLEKLKEILAKNMDLYDEITKVINKVGYLSLNASVKAYLADKDTETSITFHVSGEDDKMLDLLIAQNKELIFTHWINLVLLNSRTNLEKPNNLSDTLTKLTRTLNIGITTSAISGFGYQDIQAKYVVVFKKDRGKSDENRTTESRLKGKIFSINNLIEEQRNKNINLLKGLEKTIKGQAEIEDLSAVGGQILSFIHTMKANFSFTTKFLE